MKVTSKQYAVALYQATKDAKRSEVVFRVRNFFWLIVSNNDISQINKIVDEFNKIWNREQGVVEAQVISARRLDKEIIRWLSDYIALLAKAKRIEIKQIIDRSLLGGVVIKFGDKVIDSSLKTKLNELKQQMIK